MKPENLLVRRIRAAMENEGAYTIKMHGDVFTPVGTPDVLGCYEGHFIALEVKHPDETHPVSAVQHYRLSELARRGARVGIVEDVERAIQIMKGL